MKKLFLDDVWTLSKVYPKDLESDWDIVRNYQDFVSYIKRNGLPHFISFDNDLGLDQESQVALVIIWNIWRVNREGYI